MSEFIGSRISLISKSDIKYVGTLHEINSENSTVALENVKSWGTEGRKGDPSLEIPPSDQIYEYIVFRGSDVKDLTIVEPPKENKPPPQVPNDPAILGAARPQQHHQQSQQSSQQPPQQSSQQQQQQQQQQPNQQWRGQQPPPFPPYGYPPQNNPRFAPPGGLHGFPGAPGAVPGYGMPYGGPPPPGWFPPNHGFPGGPPPFSPQQGQQMPGGGPPGQNVNQQQRGPDGGSTRSKQPTPSQPSGMQAPPPPNDTKPTELSATPASSHSADTAPPPPNDTKPETAAATAPPETRPAARTAQKNSRVAVPLASRPNAQGPAKSGNAGATPAPAAANAAQQHQATTQAAAAAVAAAMAKLGPVSGQQPTQTGGQTSVDNLTKKVGEMRTDDRIRHSRQPGTGGFAAGHRGGRGNRRPSTRETGPKPVDVPSADFDFESSNAKFNKQDLVKEAIASGSPIATPGEDESKEIGNTANGAMNGNAAHEDDVVIPGTSQAKTYNKSTSFFDNISSELKDRQTAQDQGKQLGGMEFRSEERKKNMETFGQSNVENGYGRGGFRGRGRGRGGPNGGGRGRGYSGGRGGYVPRGGPGARGDRGGAEGAPTAAEA